MVYRSFGKTVKSGLEGKRISKIIDLNIEKQLTGSTRMKSVLPVFSVKSNEFFKPMGAFLELC